MLTFLSVFLAALSIAVAIPGAVFFIEVIAALALPDRDYSVDPINHDRRRIAVVVPAHNESTAQLPTLADVKGQLHAGDRLLVVADNCSDDTAAQAVAAGADVIERNDPDKRGKGYALAWAIKHLEADPPDVVVIVDADCRLPDGALEKLAATCLMTERPIQSLSSMITRRDSPINTRVAEFAWRVKNYVRPRGLCNLGLPCQLMGSGMAFPWNLIRTSDFGRGSLVEDMKLGLDLALAGKPPIFCPFPGVISEFPFTNEGVQSQRQRWEQGHIRTILTTAPRLFAVAIRRANLELLALALDLSVPPLTLLCMLVVGMVALTSLATLLGASSTPMWISLVSLALLVSAGFLSWLAFGRKTIPPSLIILVFPYAVRKFMLYVEILSGRASSRWVRTDRTKNNTNQEWSG